MSDPKKVLIEQTSKKYKLHMAIATVITVIAFILGASAGLNQWPEWVAYTFAVLFFGGIIYAIVVKVLIWWQHE